MQTIETETYDFPTMRHNNRIYVDKTGQFYDLITGNTSLHFLARPRRFGKSLMISTLDCIFRGRKELFEGLAISRTNYDWPVHPVLRFDFSAVATGSLEEFKQDFRSAVLQKLQLAGATIHPEESAGANLGLAIQELCERLGKRVVVLVDEYDAPIGHALQKPALAEAIREEMRAFYIHLKANVDKLRFLMMTGVSKFSQVSVFSALNNISDLTLDVRAATLLGYTDEELETYFHDAMAAHAQKMGLDYDTYRERLRFWYNGYHFSPDCLGPKSAVYNPFAIARTLTACAPYFKPTWASTGRPSMLMNYIKREHLERKDLENLTRVSEDLMASASVDELSAIALLFQSGYLTIKDYAPEEGYTLGVPDEEVRQDLFRLMTRIIPEQQQPDHWYDETLGFLCDRHFEDFFDRLKAYYADVPYGSHEGPRVDEASYLRLLYTMLRSRYPSTRVCYEKQQAGARPDLVMIHSKSVFLFELKVNRDGKTDAQTALAQIRTRSYAEPLRCHNLPIYAIGLAFNPKTHRLVDCAAEAL